MYFEQWLALYGIPSTFSAFVSFHVSTGNWFMFLVTIFIVLWKKIMLMDRIL